MRTTRALTSSLTPILALLLAFPLAAFAEEVILQTVQFPEDRDIDVEFDTVERIPGRLDAEVEYEDGAADVRLRADGMVPALALGGDVTSYVAWTVTPGGTVERLGELPILHGREKIEYTTDLKDFAVLVTLEEHPKVERPSSRVAFRNRVTDEKGAISRPLSIRTAGEPPRIAEKITRLRVDERVELELLQARRVFELAEERGAEPFAPDRFREARVTLGQAENFLDGGREKKALDYAQRSRSAAADALLERSRELERRALLAEEKAERAERDRLATRAEVAEERGDELEDALHQSERSRLDLQQQIAEQRRELEATEARAAELAAERLRAEQQLETARAELQALDMESESARARADALMEERARLSRTVGELRTEQQTLAARQQALIAQQSDLQKENEALARQKAEAEAERERLAREKAEVVADLYGTLDEIAETRRTARGLVVSLPDVFFDFDKATLRPEGTRTLSKLAGVALLVPGLEFSVEGHTDAIGTESYNDWLSKARAESVADFLVQEGVRPDRLETRGFGESRPVAPNDSADNRQLNRRVEIVVDKDSLPERTAAIE